MAAGSALHNIKIINCDMTAQKHVNVTSLSKNYHISLMRYFTRMTLDVLSLAYLENAKNSLPISEL